MVRCVYHIFEGENPYYIIALKQEQYEANRKQLEVNREWIIKNLWRKRGDVDGVCA